MKTPSLLTAFALSSLALTQCGADGNAGSPTATQIPNNTPAGFTSPLTSEKGNGTVTIRQEGKVLSSFGTAGPNVEETRWYSEQEQIVVKSRGNHGPATVQLFDSRTGAVKGSVKAFEITPGNPAWAQGMAE